MSGHCVPTLDRKKRYTDPGDPYQLMFKGPTCHRTSWQPGQSATDPDGTIVFEMNRASLRRRVDPRTTFHKSENESFRNRLH
ncbi:hypothetical protein AVEN_250877-1 [Araneus ventricosus]|uniref:Uncharacterized protein n=1 Tax=Araneus ventricosus TaxID=182803 RepID=A0A4Y2W009_ARAVE|nr:hypothetical protein AVEN_250877-1 [Araneus ventricosus]